MRSEEMNKHLNRIVRPQVVGSGDSYMGVHYYFADFHQNSTIKSTQNYLHKYSNKLLCKITYIHTKQKKKKKKTMRDYLMNSSETMGFRFDKFDNYKHWQRYEVLKMHI